jgi:PAS domain S-box-containing protein
VKVSNERKILAGSLIALVVLVFAGLTLVGSASEQKETAAWVARTHQVLDHLGEVKTYLSDAENGRRGYVLSGQDRYWAHYGSAVEHVEEAIRQLRMLTAAEPRYAELLDRLNGMILARLEILTNSIQGRRQGGLDLEVQVAFMEEGQQAMEPIRAFLASLVEENYERLQAREAARLENVDGTVGFAVLASALSLGLFTTSFVLFARESRRRRRAEADLQETNVQLEGRVAERTSALTKAFNSLEQAELRLRLVIETSLDGVITIDAKGRVTGWNPQAERIFGWSRAEVMGKRLSETIVPERHREAHERGLNNYAATGKGPMLNRRLELEAVNRDGHEFPVELSITPILSGTSVTFSAFIRDVTGRKEAEQEIRRLNAGLEARVRERTAQLEAAHKELEAFCYSVSHDLRAPLRGIDGYVRILEEDHRGGLDAEGNRLLGVVSKQAKRMGCLIDDLLDFSRLGRRPMNRVEVELTSLARSVFESLTAEVSGSGSRLDLKPLPSIPGDPAMLRQVFVNLIGNAVKFSRHQPAPVVKVGGSSANGEATCYVKDNGVGFDEKYAHKLFGVFQRLHTEAEFEGTGVGLALVQRIVERHGGRVWAESRPGQGATFYFALPTRKEDPE